MSLTVRKCGEDDRAELGRFFQKEPYYGLFFMGNVQKIGFSNPGLHYWGGYHGDELVAVLMNYYSNWSILAGDEPFDLSPLVAVLDQHDNVDRWTGKQWIIEEMMAKSQRYRFGTVHHDYFCALQEEDFVPGSVEGVRKSDLSDEQAVHHLYAQGEFHHITGDVYRRRLSESGCRSFVLETGGRMVSTAGTSAETNEAAMIGGVFTLGDERGKGYGSRVMTALCRELLAEGIEPCLFYDNPSAGVIYRRLGFRDIGMFLMTQDIEEISAESKN
jgi:uncharacterized protein